MQSDTLAYFGATPIWYRRGMGAKRVDGHDNGNTANSYGNPVGVECEGCGRRALVPLDRLGSARPTIYAGEITGLLLKGGGLGPSRPGEHNVRPAAWRSRGCR